MTQKIKRRLKKLAAKKDAFDEKDFVETLNLTMQQQLLEHPALELIYKKLTPEFEALVQRVALLYETPDEATEQALFEELLKGGEPALLASLEYLLHLKKIRGKA